MMKKFVLVGSMLLLLALMIFVSTNGWPSIRLMLDSLSRDEKRQLAATGFILAAIVPIISALNQRKVKRARRRVLEERK
jgi:hypothetical protein